MNILGIESSCDETAAAVVTDGPKLLSSVVASQIKYHRPFGGIVPEIASRNHIRFITQVIEKALRKSRLGLAKIDGVAATGGPGLAGSLLVGSSAGKALAYLTGKPFLAVNHIEAHIYAAFLEDPSLEPPLLALVVSGGHTELISMERHGEFRILGRTRDDAAGEAYDKVAKLIGLGYPGGPRLEKLARRARNGMRLPVARMKDGSLDFSFSGLKTAVSNVAGKGPARADVAAGFQQAVIAALRAKTRSALRASRAPALVFAGGVAANAALRRSLADLASQCGVRFISPRTCLCTDNAAMIAAAAWYRMRKGQRMDLNAPTLPNWVAGEDPARTLMRKGARS